MIKTRKKTIDEIKYPHNLKKDDITNQINCHFNKNKWHNQINNQIYEDKDYNNENIDFITII